MKVKTNIMLDEEVKRVVVDHLGKMGMSLSSFINSLLAEYVKEIKGQPVMLNKPLQELTLKEFGELASYWIQKASE